MFDFRENEKKLADIAAYIGNANKVYRAAAGQNDGVLSAMRRNQAEELKKLGSEKAAAFEREERNYASAVREAEHQLRVISDTESHLKGVDAHYGKFAAKCGVMQIDGETRAAVCKELGIADFSETCPLPQIAEAYKQTAARYIDKPLPKAVLLGGKRRAAFKKLILLGDLAVRSAEEEKRQAKARLERSKSSLTETFQARTDELVAANRAQLACETRERGEDLDFIGDEAVRGMEDLLPPDMVQEIGESEKQFAEEFGGEGGAFCRDGAFPRSVRIAQSVLMVADALAETPAGQKIGENFPSVFADGFAMLPCREQLGSCRNFFIRSAGGESRGAAAEFIGNTVFEFIRQLPVNGVEINVFDPDKKGMSVKNFLSLKEKVPEMFAQKIFTSYEDIRNRLSALNDYVDSVIQQKLSNRYKNVLEYNDATPDNPLPVKLVCVFDFPKFFDAGACESLISIMKNGEKCGIFVFIAYNEEEDETSGYGSAKQYIEKIRQAAYCLVQNSGYMKSEGSGMFLLSGELPGQAVLDEFIDGYAQAAKKNLSKGIVFDSVCSLSDMFTRSSADGLSIPVGKGDGSAVEDIEFGKIGSSHHAMITGGTGSGKSTLLHTIILSAALHYSPDDLQMYLMDFKSGTEFKIYETYPIPHIRLLALDAMQEFGESILLNLNAEMERRSVLFKESGVSDIAGYVRASGKKLPRILVIMDEFQVLFDSKSNRSVAQNCAHLTNEIVKLGRSYGIHLIMSTQTVTVVGSPDCAISSDTVGQMRIRIGLKFSQTEAGRLFGAAGDDAFARMRGAIGTAVYNKDFTECGNIVFRTAYCSGETKKKYLEAIAKAAAGKGDETKVFEGSRVPAFPQEEFGKPQSQGAVELLLGAPIKVADYVRVAFTKKQNSNLLCVGKEGKLMESLTQLLLISLARAENTCVYLLDGNDFIGEPPAEYMEKAAEHSPEIFRRVRTRPDFLRMVESLAEEVSLRKKGKSEDARGNIVFVRGFHDIDVLCKLCKGERVERSDYIEEEEDSKEKPAEPAGAEDFRAMFAALAAKQPQHEKKGAAISYRDAWSELISGGYSFGVHFIMLSTDALNTVDALGSATYSQSLNNRFTKKIVFGLSDENCVRVASPVETSPKSDITCVFSDGKEVLQFKPFALPETKEQTKQEE